MVALIDRDDPHHERCVAALPKLPPDPLVTTWPCLTEAMHLLYRAGGLAAQNELWSFVADGLVRLHVPGDRDWEPLLALMNQYGDMPLDMAGASHIHLAGQMKGPTLFSLDQRLRAVRPENAATLAVVP